MLMQIDGNIDKVKCPRCGTWTSFGLCYACGNSNLPDVSIHLERSDECKHKIEQKPILRCKRN